MVQTDMIAKKTRRFRRAAQFVNLRVVPPPSTDPARPHRVALFSQSTWRFSLYQGVSIFLAALLACIGYHEIFLHRLGPLPAFIAVGLLTALLFAGAMRLIEGSRHLRLPLGREALRDVTLVWAGAVLLVTFICFALKADLSRGAMLSFIVLGYGTILLSRKYLPSLISATGHRMAVAPVLVVGAKGHSRSSELIKVLSEGGSAAPSFIELDCKCSDETWHTEFPAILGTIFAAARASDHGDICISAEGISMNRLRDIASALQILPRAVRVIPDADAESLLHFPVRSIAEFYSVELQRAPMGPTHRAAKRLLDLVVAGAAAIFLMPLLLLIALLIKLDSRGPILFSQNRTGFRGNTFRIFKFRTMTTLEDGDTIQQATKTDARVTRLGYWLRRSSLDELPQLLNVLKGEMSLVGPRPHAVAHDRFYSTCVDNYEIRHHVKPGITGWAQVNGLRGETQTSDQMSKRVQMDLWYAKNAHLLLDLKILFLTIGVVFSRRNAF